MLCCALFGIGGVVHILQGCFNGIETVVGPCRIWRNTKLMKLELHYRELWYIWNKTKQDKTVRMFPGIYCTRICERNSTPKTTCEYCLGPNILLSYFESHIELTHTHIKYVCMASYIIDSWNAIFSDISSAILNDWSSNIIRNQR